jgi:hypothetical protein
MSNGMALKYSKVVLLHKFHRSAFACVADWGWLGSFNRISIARVLLGAALASWPRGTSCRWLAVMVGLMSRRGTE